MWLYHNKPFEETLIEKNVGFVYIITNTINEKQYIGKKLFKHRRNKKLVESDWRTYFGSNKILQEEVKTLGENYFTKEIIRLGRTKSECSYYEAKLQFEKDVLLNPEKFYNDWILIRVTRKHLKSLIN